MAGEDGPDTYFDETDAFFEEEMKYRERGDWGDLLSLYERELEDIPDEEEANDLRARIESARKKVYEDADEADY